MKEIQEKKVALMTSVLLHERETAELLGMSVHWLRRKRWEGDGVPFIRLGDGSKGAIRYRLEDIDRYIAARVRLSTSDKG
jgi:predicted DNA-binding transcriptional regulator AlpA